MFSYVSCPLNAVPVFCLPSVSDSRCTWNSGIPSGKANKRIFITDIHHSLKLKMLKSVRWARNHPSASQFADARSREKKRKWEREMNAKRKRDRRVFLKSASVSFFFPLFTYNTTSCIFNLKCSCIWIITRLLFLWLLFHSRCNYTVLHDSLPLSRLHLFFLP